MFTANAAREMLEELEINKPCYDEIRELIEDRVKEAICNHSNFCILDSFIPDVVDKWLKRLGYKVERCKNNLQCNDYTKIMW